MPWADYTCPGCPGIIVRNHRFAASLGAKESAPWCAICEIQMEPIPAIGRMDAQGGGFRAFQVTRLQPTPDGPRQMVETIDSLHKLRQVEADSEQRYRNGEGEPLRFRAWANTDSNKDVNSFGESGQIGDRTYGEAPTLVRNGRVHVKRHGGEEPEAAIGPGMAAAYTPL